MAFSLDYVLISLRKIDVGHSRKLKDKDRTEQNETILETACVAAAKKK